MSSSSSAHQGRHWAQVPGAKNGGSDKGPDGNRIDSIPIANGVIKAGGACDLILYDAYDHASFVKNTAKYDALIVRINPGQLSQGTPDGTQKRFDVRSAARHSSALHSGHSTAPLGCHTSSLWP